VTVETGAISIATGETVHFIAGHAPSGAQLIEVGCGAGEVAVALMERGIKVTGIESDPDRIAVARSRGVDVIAGRWPDVDVPRADVVVFTRSLHHIAGLGAAVAHAKELLGVLGLLLVEDFAFESADAATVDWFRSVVAEGIAQGVLRAVPEEFATRVMAADDALEAWHEDHDHDLHGWPEMANAVADRFSQISVSEVPYLYRYLIPVAEDSPEAVEFVRETRDREGNFDDQAFRMIGRRLVAHS
jgi:SAM-dependent methyltransferase